MALFPLRFPQVRVLRLDLGFPNGAALVPPPQDVGDTSGDTGTSWVGWRGCWTPDSALGRSHPRGSPDALSLSLRSSNLTYRPSLLLCPPVSSLILILKFVSVPRCPRHDASLLATGDRGVHVPHRSWLVPRARPPADMCLCFPCHHGAVCRCAHIFPSVCLSV